MSFRRRAFLTLLAMVGIVYGIFRNWRSIGAFFADTNKEAQPVVGRNVFHDRQKSLVAAVGGADVKEMVGKAVSLIGGFELLELNGKRVLVKPNVVGGAGNPTTTAPEVVEAVVELVYEAGAANVYVGDMSALIRGNTGKNMETTGIAAAARRAGAQTLAFEDYGWVKVKVDGRYVREVDVSEWFFNVDRVINLPVIKTHRYAGYSICLKNFVGATHFSQRPYLIDRNHWEEVVAEINLAFRPDLNIVDGTNSMVEGGPWDGTAVQTSLVLAGGDRVACDVVGLGIIQSFGQWEPLKSISPWQMRQVRRAAEIGLGAGHSEEMRLLSHSLNDDPSFLRLMEQVRSRIESRKEPV